MKIMILPKMLYIGIAIATLSLGIATVASVRLAVVSVVSIANNLKVLKQTEPMPVPETVTAVAVEPSVTIYGIDEEINSSEEVDPSGEYYLDPEKVPKAFSEISHLELQTREYYEENGSPTDRPKVPVGSLHAKKAWKFTRIAIGGREIAFQTIEAGGISYRFVGQFAAGEYCETGGAIPELKGKLIKIKDGRWSAEMVAEFYLQCGC